MTDLKNVDYSSGTWYINEDSEIVMEQVVWVDLTPEIWVGIDDNLELCKVNSHTKKFTSKEEQEILEKYADEIAYAREGILEDFADGYRYFFDNRGWNSEVKVEYDVDDNDNDFEVLAEPFANCYIVKIK